MKRVGMGVLALMLGVVGVVEAGGWHKPKNGKDGRDGIDGVDGSPGPRGPAGDDSLDALRVNVGAAVQWHEWDNHLSLNSGYRYDLNHHGHVVDAVIVGYRFGKSATDRRIDELEARIAALSLPAPMYFVPGGSGELITPAQGVIRGQQ